MVPTILRPVNDFNRPDTEDGDDRARPTPAPGQPQGFEQGVGFRLAQLTHLFERTSKRVARRVAGLTLAQARVLFALAEGPPWRFDRLAERCLLERSHLSVAVDGLKRRDMVATRSVPGDARRLMVEIRPGGRDAAARMEEALAGYRARLLATLDEDEWRRFAQACDRLARTAERDYAALAPKARGEG